MLCYHVKCRNVVGPEDAPRRGRRNDIVRRPRGLCLRRSLIEGHNLTLNAGTGIATVARNLTRTLRELGYKTDVLLSSKRAIDQKDPLLSEVGLHDALANLPPPL